MQGEAFLGNVVRVYTVSENAFTAIPELLCPYPFVQGRRSLGRVDLRGRGKTENEGRIENKIIPQRLKPSLILPLLRHG
jgi:hypothetical protein